MCLVLENEGDANDTELIDRYGLVVCILTHLCHCSLCGYPNGVTCFTVA